MNNNNKAMGAGSSVPLTNKCHCDISRLTIKTNGSDGEIVSPLQGDYTDELGVPGDIVASALVSEPVVDTYHHGLLVSMATVLVGVLTILVLCYR